MNPATWKQAEILLARIDQDTHTLEDIKAAIDAKIAQLWAGRDSVIVTELIGFPRKRVCRIWLAAGDMDELTGEMLPDVEDWAKAEGCATVEIIGRKGWTRVLKGYREPVAVLEKELGR